MSSPDVSPVDLPLELWLEIFRLATYITPVTTIAPLDPFIPKRLSHDVMSVNTPFLSMYTKRSLVLVCRSWRQVATELLYEYLIIGSPRRANLVLDALRRGSRTETGGPRNSGSDYGKWTRHIEVHTHARGAVSERFLQTVFDILTHCRDLRMLSGTWTYTAPVAFLEAVTRLYGSSLQSFYWKEQATSNTCITAEFLASFRTLRVLDVRNAIGDSGDPPNHTHKPILPCVTDLLISAHPSSISIVTQLILPSFLKLTLEMSKIKSDDHVDIFLSVHGPNITRLELVSFPNVKTLNASIFLQPGVCPNLVDLVLHKGQPILKPLAEPHTALRRIGLRGVTPDQLYPKHPSHAYGHLKSFTRQVFPALEVVRMLGLLADASTDELTRDVFVWWAEKFEKDEIDFQDGEGVVWLYADPVTAVPQGQATQADAALARKVVLQEVTATDVTDVPRIVLAAVTPPQETHGPNSTLR